MRLVSTNESADGKKVTYRFELEDLFEHERCRRGTFLAHLIAHANGVTVTRFLGQILLAEERRLLDKVELTPNTHPTEILLGDPCMHGQWIFGMRVRTGISFIILWNNRYRGLIFPVCLRIRRICLIS